MGGLILTLALTFVFSAPDPVQVISIYLHPRAAEGVLTLGDIADVEGETGMTGDIESLAIDAAVWSDGFIDRGEVLSLLQNLPGPSYCVYGSAVRVDGSSVAAKPAATIMAGMNVTLIVVKKGIRVRVKGVALQEGNTGDTVRVKTGSNAVMEGRVMKNGSVERIL